MKGVPRSLFALARSNATADRTDAGRALAGLVGNIDAERALIALVNEPHNSLLSTDTAVALLERRDLAALRVLALALAIADEETRTHVFDTFHDVTQTAGDLEDLLGRCRLLAEDPDPRAAAAASTMLAWFSHP